MCIYIYIHNVTDVFFGFFFKFMTLYELQDFFPGVHMFKQLRGVT